MTRDEKISVMVKQIESLEPGLKALVIQFLDLLIEVETRKNG